MEGSTSATSFKSSIDKEMETIIKETMPTKISSLGEFVKEVSNSLSSNEVKERRNVVDQAIEDGGIENFKNLDYSKFTSFLKQELLQLLETLSTVNAFISFKKPALKDSQSFESNVQTELLQEVRGHRHICAAMIDSLSELTQHRQKILQELIEDPSLEDLYEAVYQCETSFGSTLYKGANDIQMSYVVLYDLLLKNIDVLTNNALPSNKNKNTTSRVARNPRGKYSKKVL